MRWTAWALGVIVLALAWAAACGLNAVGAGEGPAPDAARPPEAAAPGDAGDAGNAGCDADLDADPSNCGACGRSCLGSTCIARTCAPVVVLSVAGGAPRDVRVRGTFIYWVDAKSGTIQRASLDAGGTGAGAAPVTLVKGQDMPVTLEVTADSIYWTNAGTKGAGLWRAGSSGEMPQQPFGSTIVGCFAVDALGVVWVADRDNGNVQRLDNNVLAPPVQNQAKPWGITVKDGELFWSSLTMGEIYRAALDGTNQVSVVAGLKNPLCLANDGARIYWPNDADGGGAIQALEPDGAVREIAGGQTNLGGITVDDTAIYWTSGQQILRIAR
jgi:hypothetical protein